MANLKAGTLIGGNMIWNAGNMPLRVDGSNLFINSTQVYTKSYKPTPADVGALALTGGTVTGNVVISGAAERLFLQDDISRLRGRKSNGDASWYVGKGSATSLDLYFNEVGSGLKIESGNNGLSFKQFKVYHEGNKPTTTELGALALTGGTVTGTIVSSHGTTQFQGQRAGANNLNDRFTESEMGWAYTGTGEYGSVTNGFPMSNNANGVLTFNTHSGAHNHQIGMSSNGRLYHRFRSGSDISDWAAMYSTLNKPTARELSVAAKYEMTFGGSNPNWICVGRIARTDNAVCLILSGNGDFGGRTRDNITISMAARGNVVQLDANRFKRQNPYGGDVRLYTKDTGSAFELWMKTAAFQHSVYYTLLAEQGWVDMRSGTTTTEPSGLVEVVINDIFTTTFRPDLGHINAGTFGHDFKVVAGKKIILPTTDYAAGTTLEALPAGDGYGSNFVLHSGGNVVISSGEAATNLRNLTTGEILYLASDEQIRFISGAQTWGNRKTMLLGGDGYLTINEGTSDARIYLGSSSSYVSRFGNGLYLTNTADSNSRVYIEGKTNPIARVNGTDYTIYHTGYQPSELRGSNYVSGGTEKPNFFGAGKLRYQMLRTGAFGSTTYEDALWISSYTGNDVKISNLLTMSKGGNPRIGFRQQSYDATSWGTFNEIYHTNFKPTAADIRAVDKTGDTMTGRLRVDHGSAGVGLVVVGPSTHQAMMGVSTNVNESLFGSGTNGSNIASFIRVGASPNRLTFSPAGTEYLIYHQGNKPTTSDIGALPISGGTLTGQLQVKDGLKSAMTFSNGATLRFNDGGNAWMHMMGYGGAIKMMTGNDSSQSDSFLFKSNGVMNAYGKPPSMNEGTYNGNTEGGSFRRGQGVFHAKAAHQGSSWAPMFSSYFHDTQGYDGFYTFGHLSDSSGAGMGKYCLQVMNGAGDQNKYWSFDGQNGDFVSPGNVVAYSDARVKKNIEVIVDALDKIDQIRGVTYDRTDIEGVRHMGVIAQEVEKVAPEVITTSVNGDIEDFKAVAYGNLSALLIEGIKELRGELREIKAHLGL